MSKIQIVLEFDGYEPADDDPFRVKATSEWLTRSGLKDYVSERIDKVTSMMDEDDHLTIAIGVMPKGEQ